MARIPKSESGILRAELISAISAAVAQGANLADIQKRFILSDRWAENMTHATRDAYGGATMRSIEASCIRSQKNRCLLCEREFYSTRDGKTVSECGTSPDVILLVPGILWAEPETTGRASTETGYVPGNMIAGCILCKEDRVSLTLASGTPVMETAESLGNKSRFVCLQPNTSKAPGRIDRSAPYVVAAQALRNRKHGW